MTSAILVQNNHSPPFGHPGLSILFAVGVLAYVITTPKTGVNFYKYINIPNYTSKLLFKGGQNVYKIKR